MEPFLFCTLVKRSVISDERRCGKESIYSMSTVTHITVVNLLAAILSD